ncbi:MAG: glycoside hydrolase family 43 protein [Parabacteroides sp.]
MKIKMIYYLLMPLLALCGCKGTTEKTTEGKTFHPGELWPDNNGVHINAHGGGIWVEGDTYYWFGEHKTAGRAGNKAQVGVHCYSSKNLYDWTDEGIALVVSEDENSPIAKECILERPKVIYNQKTGKYVMWFHLEPKGAGYSGAQSGVATSDCVTGPYTLLSAARPNAGQWPMNVLEIHKGVVPPEAKDGFSGGSVSAHPDTLNLLGRDFAGGQMARDMNLFVDDDGKAYHIYASEENSTLHISELTDDYTACSGRYARFFVGRFMEAPAMFKQNGKYYLIMSGCTGWAPNAGRSAVASSIWGPWEELENPFRGEDSETSFHSQSTYVLPVPGKKGEFIYMGDRWTPDNAIDGRYIWLPLHLEGDQPVIEWKDCWSY